MKIKRFDNIWIMGLILSGTILVVLYVVKLLFPSFIIETAQNEKICLIGNYIDTHEWAWFLSSTVLSFVSYYFLCCACCGKTKLSLIELGIILVAIIIGYLIRKFLNDYYYTAIILKTKQSKIADELCINEKSVQVRKKRLKIKLNSAE